jgi:hypothetical protein
MYRNGYTVSGIRVTTMIAMLQNDPTYSQFLGTLIYLQMNRP